MYHFGDSEQNTDWIKPQGSPAQLRDLLATEQALLAYYTEEEGADPEQAAVVQKRIDELQERLAAKEAKNETSNPDQGGRSDPGTDRPDLATTEDESTADKRK